jgi:hypothetical protein
MEKDENPDLVYHYTNVEAFFEHGQQPMPVGI